MNPTVGDMPSAQSSLAATQVNAEYVERCQAEYQRNPRSRIFAPLAESYRKMGLLDEALRTCEAGLSHHPAFAGGRVVMAKCLLDRNDLPAALAQLEKATQASPDNLLAHSLMGETLLQLRRPKDALRAFKMALFLNPQDERARQAVRKWEFLTADEYDAALFAERSLGQPQAGSAGPPHREEPGSRVATPPPAPIRLERELERALSLADAFTVRNNLESAQQVLETARERLGTLPEIENRLALLSRRLRILDSSETPEPIRPIGATGRPERDERKRAKLEAFLRRITQRRR